MCGITGIFDTRAPGTISRALLERMNDSQRHRGPDEGGLYIAPGIGFGHRRLSVIDIATGQQPLCNADSSVVLVFNGEIYNYQPLMAELQALGHVFHSKSDTEVIVHAWEAWGEACVPRLRGMFAFVLWDHKRQTLFMARDRMGVKPLYYAMLDDGTLLFGSELKSILAHGGVRRVIDPLAVEEYFALGYVPEPRTIFQAVKKLPPAHTLTVRRGLPAGRPVPYWDLCFTLDSVLSQADAQVELVERLRDAVAVRLVSEVPLGAFLSGGVDSSAVVALMAGLSPSPITTCSIGFDAQEFDESVYAQQVATRHKTRHWTEVVGSNDFGLIDTLSRLYDEPYADSSAIPTYRVCQLARRHVTVALSGDGADEALAGYSRYRTHVREEHMRSALPMGLRGPLFGALGRVYPKADWAWRVLRAKTTFESMARDSVEAYFHAVSVLKTPMRQALFTGRFKAELGGYSALEVFRRHASAAHTQDPLALIQYLDLKTYLADDINTKVDRASMAHGLEVREPMMDHVLIEWLATLPSHQKLQGKQGKALFKKAMEPYLPHGVLYRTKMGFSVPLADWFRGPLKQRLQDTVLGERLLDTGWFDPHYMRQLVESHQSGARDHSAPLWSLMMFDAFLKNVVETQPAVSMQVSP
ncbi:MAG: XrtA/PEP-CTERM system amidotransferase [Pseudomonadota bacterium]